MLYAQLRSSSNGRFAVAIILAFVVAQAPALAADDEAADRPFLAPLFSSNAVLQRDRAVPIWGWTKPGDDVTVALGSGNFSTRADAGGKWLLKLPAQPAGGPHVLTVTGTQSDARVTLDNVLFGDVWICSGQSNMEWTVALARASRRGWRRRRRARWIRERYETYLAG